MINYKVTYHNDCGAWVDPNPTVKIFDLHDEMTDWIMEEVQRRVDDIVQNSFDTVSDSERSGLEEEEYYRIKIEEVYNNEIE
tara:strand:+ start:471 stop:716 length:246 start_codon:yes stop_codon:yes gene_type:complete